MRRVEISKRLVLINFASSALTQLLTVTVLLWLQQYLLKRISVEEYSILPVVYAVMSFTPLATVILLGGIGRFITEAYARGDDEGVTRICSTMFPILLVAGLIFLVVGWLFAWNIDHFLRIAPDRVWDARLMMGLLIFTAALRLPAAPFDVGFFVRQKFILQNFISIGCTLFRIGLLFVLLFGVSTRVLWVTTASVAMEFLLLFVSIPISMRLVPALRFRPSLIQWSIAREITSFGGWQFFMVVGISIRNALDPLVLNKFAKAEDVACYNLASVPFQQLWTIVAMAKRTVNPSLIAMHARGDHHRLQSTFLRGNRIALWAYLLPGLPLTLFAHALIEMYVGPRFWMTAGLIQINFFAFLVLVPAMIFSSISEAMGNPRNFCLLVLGTNLLNLVLTFLFVGWLQWGALGSSVASALAPAICYPLFVWPMSRRALNIRPRDWFLEVMWPGVLPALCAAPIYVGAAMAFGVETVPGLIASLALGCGAYVTCLYLFAARGPDREDFARIFTAMRERAGFGQS